MNISPSPEQIRALVDTVEAPSLASIIERSTPTQHDRRVRPALVLAAVVVVALVVASIVVLRTTDDQSRSVRAPVADGAASEPAGLADECLVTSPESAGCPMAPSPASTHLGFRVRVPTDIPEGWEPLYAKLKVYRDGVSPEPVPPGADVLLYQQAWAPAGTDLNAQGTCPPYLWVKERRAFDLEPQIDTRFDPIDLGSGQLVTGHQREGSCGSTGERQVSSLLTWTSKGIWITMVADGLGPEQVRAIARSIYD